MEKGGKARMPGSWDAEMRGCGDAEMRGNIRRMQAIAGFRHLAGAGVVD